MLPFIQRYSRSFIYLFAILLGISLGHLAATIAGIGLSPPPIPANGPAEARKVPPKRMTLRDYQVITERNIFDSTARKTEPLAGVEPTREAAPAKASRSDLLLFGTVTAGEKSLALIGEKKKEILLYHLDDELPGGGRIEEIERNLVTIRNQDGSLESLMVEEEPADSKGKSKPRTRASRPGADNRIKSVGENRWVISEELAGEARGNLGELLKSARMEPNMVEGRTEGFTVKMVRPRSLLAQLGIRKGDVLKQVNGVELDSPEKALQIFQQLREARQISVGISRRGKPINLDYEVE